MRNLNLEAAIWYLFTSPEFFELAAEDAEATMKWFENLAVSLQVVNFGRNNQIYEMFKKLGSNYRRGAALARLGDYQLAFETADSVRSVYDSRGDSDLAVQAIAKSGRTHHGLVHRRGESPRIHRDNLDQLAGWGRRTNALSWAPHGMDVAHAVVFNRLVPVFAGGSAE